MLIGNFAGVEQFFASAPSSSHRAFVLELAKIPLTVFWIRRQMDAPRRDVRDRRHRSLCLSAKNESRGHWNTRGIAYRLCSLVRPVAATPA